MYSEFRRVTKNTSSPHASDLASSLASNNAISSTPSKSLFWCQWNLGTLRPQLHPEKSTLYFLDSVFYMSRRTNPRRISQRAAARNWWNPFVHSASRLTSSWNGYYAETRSRCRLLFASLSKIERHVGVDGLQIRNGRLVPGFAESAYVGEEAAQNVDGVTLVVAVVE